MSFIESLKANDKAGLFNSTDFFVNYSTGFLPLDYANGFMLEQADETGNIQQIPIIGIMGGKFTIIIGWTGSGKTTLASQIAGNIVRPFEESIIQYIDSEHTALKPRLLQLTGFRQDDSRLILNTEHTSIEDVMNIVDMICEQREAGGNIYKYEIPYFKDVKGKPMKAYIPTVLVIDSLYTFCSKKFFDASDELDKGTGAMREARQVSEFFNKLLPLMERYSINVFCTNHIKPKGQLDRFATPAPQLMMLKPDETVPKGFAPMYLAQNCFRLNSIKSNIYTVEDHGFSGVKTTCQIAKTKTTFVGASVDLTFNESFGYDPIYTLLEFANSKGLLMGRNPYIYFRGVETMKFNRKDFRHRMINDTEFRAMVFEELKPALLSMLGAKDFSDEKPLGDNRYVDISQLV